MATNKNRMTSVDKDLEELQPLFTVGGIVKWCNCYGKQDDSFLKKSKLEPPYDPAVPLLDIYPRNLKTGLKEIFAYPCS